jgi:serine/threonine protein kinase
VKPVSAGTVVRPVGPPIEQREALGLIAVPLFVPGDRAGDSFQIQRMLGEGGMGRVYLAHHESWDLDVVLKVPKPEILADPQHRHRVAVEAEAWTHGHLPHVRFPKDDAVRLLKLREGAIAKGVPVAPKIGRLRFEDAAQDLVDEYRLNNRDSLDELERRIKLHLKPFFGGRRLATITANDLLAFTKRRKSATIKLKTAHAGRPAA